MPSGPRVPMRTMTVDAPMRDRLARVTFWFALRRPGFVVPVVILTVFVVVTAATALREGGLTLVPLAVAVLALAGCPTALWITTRAAVLRAFPIGSTLAVGVASDRLVIEAPAGRSELPYAEVAAMRTTPQAVMLRSVRGRVQILPRVLLSADQLTALRARLGRRAT